MARLIVEAAAGGPGRPGNSAPIWIIVSITDENGVPAEDLAGNISQQTSVPIGGGTITGSIGGGDKGIYTIFLGPSTQTWLAGRYVTQVFVEREPDHGQALAPFQMS